MATLCLDLREFCLGLDFFESLFFLPLLVLEGFSCLGYVEGVYHGCFLPSLHDESPRAFAVTYFHARGYLATRERCIWKRRWER